MMVNHGDGDESLMANHGDDEPMDNRTAISWNLFADGTWSS